MALTLLVHLDVHFIGLGADKAPRTVWALLAADGAVPQSLVARELGHLGKLARAVGTLEHAPMFASQVAHHAAPVVGHIVTLLAVLLEWIQ